MATPTTAPPDNPLLARKCSTSPSIVPPGLAKEPGSKGGSSDLLYAIEDNPSWFECIIFGFQHYLAMVGGTISIPIIISSFLCLEESNPARGVLVSTIIFMSGIITFLQATFGVRLPIIQGGNFAYVIPTIALLTTAYGPCKDLPLANMTETEREEAWQVRMREVQGSIAVSALFQVAVGFTGLIGLLLTWITPLAIVPTVTLVGLSLFEVASKQGSGHWGIYLLTVGLLILMSQHMKDVSVPVPFYKRGKGLFMVRCHPFRTTSLLIAIIITWALCAILTMSGTLPEDSAARTDLTMPMVARSPWFYVPYPGQFGMPTTSVAGTLGMLAAVFASIIESVGDYYACARISGAPMPPTHAINRGIGTEGIGCMLAGLCGTGSGTTSYSGNIGILGITKVGSRRVVQVSAVIMIVCGVFGKMGAFFVTIPEPIIAAVFTIKFAMITAMGISTLQFVDLSSSRNLFVLGFSIFFGLSLPKWMQEHGDAISTGVSLFDQTLVVLLQTSMFVGGFLGFLLDNTIPGTDEERGLLAWKGKLQTSSDGGDDVINTCYDLPLGMSLIKRAKWMRFIPFCPRYKGLSKDILPSCRKSNMNGGSA
ncbi:solute carrier family 23 member 1-like [Penaeus monodon]|uniref:solute carrier family 23 member 1-like n=1 Tax=Penaeus monodon TaxID=6687 RepID=UPI0018A73174|nr:solute carrier family 23 member 1-like [Penaeus monodon]